VYLAVEGTQGNGTLRLVLSPSAFPNEPVLRTSELAITLPAPPGWYRFNFPSLPQSLGQLYYFALHGELPSGAILYTSRLVSATYIDGTRYVDHKPERAQMAFKLDYAFGIDAYGSIRWAGYALYLTLVIFLLFLLPGLALQLVLLPDADVGWKERLGVAAGLSLCIYPLPLLWAHVSGLHPGAAIVWSTVGLSFAVVAWHMLRAGPHVWRAAISPRRFGARVRLPDIVSIVALALVLFVRLWVLQHTDTPLWGDSVHHAVIGQLLVDNGGLFSSWLPYAPYQSLTVHFGFHSVIAAIIWLTQLPVATATLLAGQMVNFLAILSLVPLAHRLLNNRWAGVGVLVVAGLISSMPHGYINWGRYAQLSGQAVVPVAVWLAWRLFDDTKQSWRILLLTAISWAGTLLCYYRMPHYVAAFVLVLVATQLFLFVRRSRSALMMPFLRIAATSVLTLLLVLPWLTRIRDSALADAVTEGVLQGSPYSHVQAEYQIFMQPTPLMPLPLALVAAGAFLWALIRGRMPVIVVALWTLAILLLPASRLINLPGGNKQQGFAILISLYMPVGLLVGYVLDAALSWSAHRRKSLAAVVLAGTALIGGWAMRDRLAVVDPGYRILAPADVRAMHWIRENVPADAMFLVDGFLIYNGTSAVGSDGGWWLPVLTGRKNTMPPQYALLTEQPSEPGYNDWVVQLVQQLRKTSVVSPEGIDLLCRNHISHVYLGQAQGRVGMPPSRPMLSLSGLEKSPAFTSIYRQDKVAVFALKESACVR
jgi:hypothetical protein